ncbi:uncharacterized protein LOC135924507 [Gordionus sp. m RMFG-2023]|uniref:uncharacterized protein LOC135924507 n=1 Tax=Gordionus sp. m RMFG-2023 TaxID=3053472 RepID=UPI0031FCE6B4
MSITILNSLRRKASLVPMNEIAEYLADPVVSATTTVLDWWSCNSERFPYLCMMAKDFLSQQSTSVESERVFSRGVDTVTKKRNRMASETLKQCLCLNSWDINIMNNKFYT